MTDLLEGQGRSLLQKDNFKGITCKFQTLRFSSLLSKKKKVQNVPFKVMIYFLPHSFCQFQRKCWWVMGVKRDYLEAKMKLRPDLRSDPLKCLPRDQASE